MKTTTCSNAYATAALLLGLIGHAAESRAATLIVLGADGIDGITSSVPGSDGGDGGAGERAEAFLDTPPATEPPLATDSIHEVRAQGGDGGNGGTGLGVGDGGHGAAGGDADARATLLREAGPATADAEARGGNGGLFGRSGLLTGRSGAGGPGGTARVRAEAITRTAAPVNVIASAIGGNGGATTEGIAVPGGGAAVLGAFGESAGGPVTVTASARSGHGGPGFPNTNGLFFGPGGPSRDVVLENVVDGITSGTLRLRQDAATGTAGGGFTLPGERPPRAGTAVSNIESSRDASTLDAIATATSGNGGVANSGTPAGAGGDARAGVLLSSRAGHAIGQSTAIAGPGGNASLAPLNLQRPIALGDGGHAIARTEVEGFLSSTALASAIGGSAGESESAETSVFGGTGGDANAEAHARTLGPVGRATARAVADGGAGGFSRSSSVALETARASRGGSATALATARGQALVDARAIALGSSGERRADALARSRAEGRSGLSLARATTSQGDEIASAQISSNVLGDADLEAWNARYAEGEYQARTHPTTLLESWLPALPRGRALDVACGAGRNALAMAEAGFDVDGVDISQVALERARESARARDVTVNFVETDLDAEPLPRSGYDLVVIARYVNRGLMPRLKEAMAPDGWLLFEHHLQTTRQVGGPTSREFRMRPQEVLHLCWDLRVLHYSEALAEDPDGRTMALVQIVACKGDPGF